jgi:hypothetical protein
MPKRIFRMLKYLKVSNYNFVIYYTSNYLSIFKTISFLILHPDLLLITVYLSLASFLIIPLKIIP